MTRREAFAQGAKVVGVWLLVIGLTITSGYLFVMYIQAMADSRVEYAQQSVQVEVLKAQLQDLQAREVGLGLEALSTQKDALAQARLKVSTPR